MTIREFYQQLIRVNTMELPYLPPYGANQGFADDKIIGIILFGIPKSWHKEMDRQGFDPLENSPGDLVTFLEQIESAEDFDGDKVASKKSKDSKSNSSSKKKSSSSGKGSKWCDRHEWCNHTTDACEALKREAKKAKYSSSKGKDSKSHSNKVWSRKAEEAKEKSKKELAAFITKAVAKGVAKELASVEKKKRKASDDGEDLDLACLEGFNYELGELSLDDKTSGDDAMSEVDC